MGLWGLFTGADEEDTMEYLGSDTTAEDPQVTIAKLQKKSAIQHEIIVGLADQTHQHEIDRYEIIKKVAPGVAHKFYTPGRCDPFPEIDFVAEVKAEKNQTHAEIHKARRNQVAQTDENDPWWRVIGGG